MVMKSHLPLRNGSHCMNCNPRHTGFTRILQTEKMPTGGQDMEDDVDEIFRGKESTNNGLICLNYSEGYQRMSAFLAKKVSDLQVLRNPFATISPWQP